MAFNGLKTYYSQSFASDLEKRYPCRVIASPLHRKTIIILPSLPTSMTSKRANKELLAILSNFILNCSVKNHAFHHISLQKLEHQFSGATYRSSQRTLP